MVSMLLRSILDFAGIAALVPIIFVIADRLGNEKRLVLLLCCGVVIFILIKNCIILFLNKFQTKYQLSIYRDFSRRLFINYYNAGLMFLKKRSSVQLAYEVNGICLTFSQSVLGSLFRMAGEFFLIILMVAALIAWRPMMGLLTAVLFLPLAAVYVFTVRKRVRKIGAESLKALRAQSRTVAEAFRGFSELEIADAFGTSLNTFDKNQETIIHNRRSMEMYQLFPFFLSEMAVIAGLVILAIFGGNDLALTGGVFAIAAFRMIPAVRGLMNHYGTLQNNIDTVEVIEKGLASNSRQEDSKEDKKTQMPQIEEEIKDNKNYGAGSNESDGIGRKQLTFERGIEGKDLGFSFPDGDVLFNHLDLKIKKGERIGIKGKSGSGKSTLFNILLGFFVPTEGEILIDGMQLNDSNRKEWHKMVGYVPQEIFIIKGTLGENIALGDKNIDEEKVWKVLEQVSLKEWAQELNEGLNTELGEFGNRLSGGQKQRIGIARALYKGAKVLFFDEATSSLDSVTEREINQALEELSDKQEELTLIIIAHRESSLTFCDRIIELAP